MKFKLTENPKVPYTDRERQLFGLLPQTGKKVTSINLVPKFYKEKPPFNSRQSITEAIKNLHRKIEANKEPFKIWKSKRAGPHPMEFSIEAR